MAMTAFELFGVLKLDKSSFDSGLKDAEKSASSTGSSLGSALGKGLSTAVDVGIKAIGAATAAVGAFAAGAVKVGSAFDSAMGGVAATLGKTVDELEGSVGEVDTAYGHFAGTLREFAMFMGQNTTFSATQAASALNYMALAGYNAQQSMDMLPAVLDMAAAGGMDLAKASDMITDTQKALGLSFERTSQMVDEFAKAASSGNTSVEQLGEAMLRIGALGSEVNGGMIKLKDGTTAATDGTQELEIAFTAMADAGIKGAEAGTHMRNMLLKLSSPTDDGAAALEEMGVAIFDTEGKMRSLTDIFGDLSGVLGTMSQENRIGIISDLFNTRDMASANRLLAAVTGEYVKMGDEIYSVSEAYEKWGDAIYDSSSGLEYVQTDWNRLGEAILNADGAATQMSKTRLDNLTGDITLWKSALESAQIVLNDQLSPTLRQFVQFGTKGIQDFTTAFQEGGLEGAMSSFGTILSNGLNMVIDMLPTAIDAGMQLLDAFRQGILDNLPTIVDAAVQIVVKLSEGFVQALPDLANGVITLIQSLGQAFSDNAETLMQVGSQMLELLWNGITTGLPMLAEGAVTVMNNLAEYLQTAIPQILPVALKALMEFSGSLRENAGLLVDGALNLIMTLAEGLIDSLPVMIETIPTIVSNIAGIINDNAPKLIATGIELIGKLVVGIVEAIPTIIAEFPKIIKAIVDVITAFNWVNLGKQIITFIANGVKSLATTIPNLLKNFGDNAANMIRNIDWYKVGTTIINFLTNGIKALTNQIPGAIRAIMSAAVTLIKNVDWLSLGINIVAGIASGISGAAGMIWDAVKRAVSGAWDSVVSFFQIASPSKKMAWAGKMVDEGFAQGIEKNADLVTSAMDDISTIPEIEAAPVQGSVGNAITEKNVIINVYGAIGQDVKELAYEVANIVNHETQQQAMAWGG